MSAEAAVKAAPAVRGRSLLQDAVRRFFRNPTGVVGLAVVLFFALLSLLAPLLRPYDATTDRNLRLRLSPPSWTLTPDERAELSDDANIEVSRWTLPFGTDENGRDLLVRVWHGGRISLRIGLIAVVLSSTVGVLLGCGRQQTCRVHDLLDAVLLHHARERFDVADVSLHQLRFIAAEHRAQKRTRRM